jgi:hypothetical protein
MITTAKPITSTTDDEQLSLSHDYFVAWFYGLMTQAVAWRNQFRNMTTFDRNPAPGDSSRLDYLYALTVYSVGIDSPEFFLCVPIIFNNSTSNVGL